MKKTIGIIGYGYVGKSIYNLFQDHYQIKIYDPLFQLNTKEEINQCDLAIICVPTPSNDDGSVNISIVKESVEWITSPLILIKSTVPPGTCEMLMEKTKKQIVFSPENIGEGRYHVPYWKGYPHPTDSKTHEYIIMGGNRKDCNDVIEYFKKVMGPFAKYFQTDFKTAELVKYVINAYLAMCVTFSNEIYHIAKVFDIDYNELRELFLLDKRISKTHTIVFDDKKGYDGKCLPKDIKGLVNAAIKSGYLPELLNQIIKSNNKFTEKNKK
jgi:UDPglucose 6-dehydrogenase